MPMEVSKKVKEDGTIYVGISPNTGKEMYVAPADAELTMGFNEAAAYAHKLNQEHYLGHDDWRVPTKSELDILYENKDQKALKDTFKCAKNVWYWSSTPYKGGAWNQRFNDGRQTNLFSRDYCSRVRLVR
jgi:hypothetical protein